MKCSTGLCLEQGCIGTVPTAGAAVASQVAVGGPAGLEPLQGASEKIAAPAVCDLGKLASGFSEDSSVLQEGLVVFP